MGMTRYLRQLAQDETSLLYNLIKSIVGANTPKSDDLLQVNFEIYYSMGVVVISPSVLYQDTHLPYPYRKAFLFLS